MHDLTKIDEIEALSIPSQREDLIRARHAIHASVGLQKLFDQAQSEQWNAERLALVLDWELLIAGVDVAPEVCRFLADEFQARDKTATLLVSAETGLAIAQVPEDAIYVPEPVAREGTDQLATPLPRLQPELEAAIVRHQNAVAEELIVISKLQARARSTELQRAEGDTRLLITTRTGRKKLGERLQEELQTILTDHTGAAGRLLSKCRLDEPVPDAFTTHASVTLRSFSSMLVADSLAMNVHHDAFGATREKIRARWTRDLARAVSAIAHKSAARTVTVEDELPLGVLICSPDLSRRVPHLDTLPMSGASETIVSGDLYLTVKDYEFEAYEEFAHWCVVAAVSVELHVDPKSLHPLMFAGVEESIVAEVVS